MNRAGTDCAIQSRGAKARMEDLDMTKVLSLKQIGRDSRQSGVNVPGASEPVSFGACVAKSAVFWLIFSVVFGFWISPEHAAADGPEWATSVSLERTIADEPEHAAADEPGRARAYGSQSSEALAEVRFTNGSGLRKGWAEGLPQANAMFPGGGNGIVESAGAALFVSGLSRYLPQDSQQGPGLPDESATAPEPHEYEQAGEQRRFSLIIQILACVALLMACVLLCSLIFRGDAVTRRRLQDSSLPTE
jgi:hypothetical protein